MADFVAVIRRAVDGLSDNTPEMRSKVYEKARSAVRRQLESMKPQPSDVMIGRQLDKLEAAIGEVESEHTEALPAIASEVNDEVIVAAETAEALEPHEEPAPLLEDDQPDTVEEDETPVESYQPEPDLEQEPEPEPEPEPELQPEPDVSVDEPEQASDEVPALETGEPIPLGFHAIEAPEEAAEQDAASVEEARPFASYPGNDGMESATGTAEPRFEEEPPAVSADDEPLEPVSTDDGLAPIGDDEASRDPFDDRVSAFQTGTGTETVAGKDPETGWNWGNDDTADIPARDDEQVSAELPPASDAWSWPVEKRSDPELVPGLEAEQKPGGWDELEELIGYDRVKDAAAASATIADSAAVPALPPFDTGEARSGSRLLPVLLIAGVLALLGGGGYAYWQERDTVNAWVSDMVAAIMPADSGGPATEETDGSAPEATTGDGATAIDDAGATKFTQRLSPDGGETDPGPAGLPAGDGTEEGTTVTAQTDSGTLAGDAQAAAESGDAAIAVPGEGGQAAAEQTPAGTGEKMFLYEERLGQSSPTAIEGTIDWSSKEESPGGDARPEPVIQGQITIPDRGVTALMTIKRNADSSLPASHLIEFVFSMPESFEGGGIDSVQRVSLKRTEQDRGDPLIAVPAKITDDFHMIALNDFPEAIATNTELLRSRNWIDIPITYRNGRRALLTIQKGTSGAEVFNRVMQSWGTAAGAAATTGQ